MNQYEQNNEAEGTHSDVPSDDAAPAMATSIPLNVEEMREHQLEMIDRAQANTNSSFDFARELILAKTPSELMDLCSTLAQVQLAQDLPQGIETAELPKAYVEACPKGREFDSITHFAVLDDAGQVLDTFDTQMEAIVWAKAEHEVLVPRHRDLSDRNNPDHWRLF